jgi:hypothetical protein
MIMWNIVSYSGGLDVGRIANGWNQSVQKKYLDLTMLHNEQFCDLYSYSIIVRIVTYSRL